MEKGKLDYIIDVGLAIAFISVAVTGIIKFIGLYPSLGIDLKLWPLKQISTIHDWSGIAITVLVLIHLIVHWKWIIAMTKSIFKK